MSCCSCISILLLYKIHFTSKIRIFSLLTLLTKIFAVCFHSRFAKVILQYTEMVKSFMTDFPSKLIRKLFTMLPLLLWQSLALDIFQGSVVGTQVLSTGAQNELSEDQPSMEQAISWTSSSSSGVRTLFRSADTLEHVHYTKLHPRHPIAKHYCNSWGKVVEMCLMETRPKDQSQIAWAYRPV